MPGESDALEQRLLLLTDFEKVANRRAALFEVVGAATDFEDMARQVAEVFDLSLEHARVLLSLPTYDWGAEGVAKRARERAQILDQLDR
jgi:hypothetical protein